MEFTIVPFSHDYYIMSLPGLDSKAMTLDHRETLYDNLKYKTPNYNGDCVRFAPVIRLYGSHKGMSACIHVHGYFPYFYIKVEELKHLFLNGITFRLI